MKKQNFIRKFFMVAALAFGIFISGAENKIYADDGGMLGSGTRTGYLGSGNRTQTETTTTDQPSEFRVFLESFYKLFF